MRRLIALSSTTRIDFPVSSDGMPAAALRDLDDHLTFFELLLDDSKDDLVAKADKKMVEKLRDELRFPSVDAMILRIHADASAARQILMAGAAGDGATTRPGA